MTGGGGDKIAPEPLGRLGRGYGYLITITIFGCGWV